MKKLMTTLIPILALVACNSGSNGGGGNIPIDPSNMQISVTPNSNGVCNSVNSPCVSVTICDSNNNNCSRVNNILLDTGSFGLRVFSSTLSSSTLNSLTPITANGNKVGECVSYGDGSQNWGSIAYANLQLAVGATATNTPIQIIDSTFSKVPSSCYNATSSPTDFGYNGILGVGLSKNDGGNYYSCNGNSCTSYNLPIKQQVANPVSLLPQNNNGITLTFDNVGSGGGSGITGQLIFGVSTTQSNTVNVANTYPATFDSNGIPVFNSQMNSINYSGFLDSGTNTLSFNGSGISGLSQCTGQLAGFFCPISTINLSPSNLNSNSNYINSSISIANAYNILNSGDSAYSNIGATIPSGIGQNYIDYGIPFFYGKTIQLVFQGSSSNIVNGPAWAW